ncbi:serine hydrolase domain-containing protein [Sphaerisporangium sp. B11E5]|uniref:serine hydrolase domain-containing protein n=1 Tax=Sphaerisporangium sp. B11E5 TaxID=3153563 RepID=UPI00325E9833
MPLTRSPLRRLAAAGLTLGLALVTCAATTVPATALAGPPAAAPAAALDRALLRQTLDAVRDAGMYGLYSAVHDGRERWQGASGVADVRTRRPVRPDMVHRVGSITKTFTTVALLQQAERGRLELDAPIARYLPDVVPGELGQAVTVRMLLNHTSGIGDYVVGAFPSLAVGSPASLDDNRFHRFTPRQLVAHGLAAPATGEPGQRFSYSNTNYVIAGLLLSKLTGGDAEGYITRHVIRKAGLRDTAFPRTPFIPGPHSKGYEALYGLIDPPRDYSVYDMSWAYTAGAVVATMDDLSAFYRALLTGRLIGPRWLAEMQTTVTVPDAAGDTVFYGLGIYAMDLPCGRFWGHDGAVFGYGTISMSSADASRQFSVGINLMKYQRVDENGQAEAHAIDFALRDHVFAAGCGTSAAATRSAVPPNVFRMDGRPFFVK